MICVAHMEGYTSHFSNVTINLDRGVVDKQEQTKDA